MGGPGGLTGKGRAQAEVLVPPDWLYVAGLLSIHTTAYGSKGVLAGDIDRPRACSKYQESVTRRLLDRNHLWWRIHLVQL